MSRHFHLNNLPDIFTDYFMTNHDIHNYNTRNASLFHKKCRRTNYNKHTLANKGTDVWNNLPLQYKEIRSFSIFKTKIKSTFFILIFVNRILATKDKLNNCYITFPILHFLICKYHRMSTKYFLNIVFLL